MVQAALQKMQDIENRRLDVLRRKSKDTYDAVLWLRANKHLFRATIHEPLMLIVSAVLAKKKGNFVNLIYLVAVVNI